MPSTGTRQRERRRGPAEAGAGATSATQTSRSAAAVSVPERGPDRRPSALRRGHDGTRRRRRVDAARVARRRHRRLRQDGAAASTTSVPNETSSRPSPTATATAATGRGQHVRGGHRQGDALVGRDDLAPPPRTAPGPAATAPDGRTSRRGAGRSARPRSPSTHQPRSRCDVHAEHEDEEGVGLHVEARAEGGHGAGASRDPAVDGVEDEGDRRQGDERGRRCRGARSAPTSGRRRGPRRRRRAPLASG